MLIEAKDLVLFIEEVSREYYDLGTLFVAEEMLSRSSYVKYSSDTFTK